MKINLTNLLRWASALGMSAFVTGCVAAPRTVSSLPCATEIHGKPIDAERRLQALVAANAASGEDLECLAYAQLALKKYSEAIATATKAIPIAADSSLAYRIRAFARYRSGEFQLAIDDAKASVTKVPCGEACEIMGKSYLRMKNYDEAIDNFLCWAQLDDSTEARCWLGSAMWQSGDTAQALLTWEAAEIAAPKDPEPFIWKAGFLYVAGDHSGALGSAQRAVDLAPNSAQALGTLARVQHWQGDLAAASLTVERLAKTNPSAAQRLAEALKSTKPAGKG